MLFRSNGVAAKTVEHLMATLHAYGITNLLVKLQDEVPAMDGSAAEFCRLVESAGVVDQDGGLEEIVIRRRIVIGRERDVTHQPARGASQGDCRHTRTKNHLLALRAGHTKWYIESQGSFLCLFRIVVF